MSSQYSISPSSSGDDRWARSPNNNNNNNNNNYNEERKPAHKLAWLPQRSDSLRRAADKRNENRSSGDSDGTKRAASQERGNSDAVPPHSPTNGAGMMAGEHGGWRERTGASPERGTAAQRSFSPPGKGGAGYEKYNGNFSAAQRSLSPPSGGNAGIGYDRGDGFSSAAQRSISPPGRSGTLRYDGGAMGSPTQGEFGREITGERERYRNPYRSVGDEEARGRDRDVVFGVGGQRGISPPPPGHPLYTGDIPRSNALNGLPPQPGAEQGARQLAGEYNKPAGAAGNGPLHLAYADFPDQPSLMSVVSSAFQDSRRDNNPRDSDGGDPPGQQPSGQPSSASWASSSSSTSAYERPPQQPLPQPLQQPQPARWGEREPGSGWQTEEVNKGVNTNLRTSDLATGGRAPTSAMTGDRPISPPSAPGSARNTAGSAIMMSPPTSPPPTQYTFPSERTSNLNEGSRSNTFMPSSPPPHLPDKHTSGDHKYIASQAHNPAPSHPTQHGSQQSSPDGKVRIGGIMTPGQANASMDPRIVHQLISRAVIESREFGVMTDVEEYKKEIRHLQQRIADLTESQSRETRSLHSAQSILQMHAGQSKKSYKQAAAQAEQEIDEINTRLRGIATELWHANARLVEVQRKYLEHTAGIMNVGMRKLDEANKKLLERLRDAEMEHHREQEREHLEKQRQGTPPRETSEESARTKDAAPVRKEPIAVDEKLVKAVQEGVLDSVPSLKEACEYLANSQQQAEDMANKATPLVDQIARLERLLHATALEFRGRLQELEDKRRIEHQVQDKLSMMEVALEKPRSRGGNLGEELRGSRPDSGVQSYSGSESGMNGSGNVVERLEAVHQMLLANAQPNSPITTSPVSISSPALNDDGLEKRSGLVRKSDAAALKASSERLRDILKRNFEELETEIDSFHRAISDSDLAAQDDLAALEQKHSAELQELKRQFEARLAEHISTRQRHEDLTVESRQLRGVIADLERAMSEKGRIMEENEKEMSRLEEARRLALERVEELEHLVSELEEKLERKSRDMELEREEAAQTQEERIKGLEARVSELEREVEEKAKEVQWAREAVEQDSRDRSEKLQEMELHVRELEQELVKKARELEWAKENADRERDESEEERITLERELDEARRLLQEHEATVQHLRQGLDQRKQEMETERGDLEKKVRQLEDELDSAEGAKKAAEDTVQRLEREMRFLEQRVKESEANLARIERERDTARREAEQTEEEKAELELMIADLRAEKENLELDRRSMQLRIKKQATVSQFVEDYFVSDAYGGEADEDEDEDEEGDSALMSPDTHPDPWERHLESDPMHHSMGGMEGHEGHEEYKVEQKTEKPKPKSRLTVHFADDHDEDDSHPQPKDQPEEKAAGVVAKLQSDVNHGQEKPKPVVDSHETGGAKKERGAEDDKSHLWPAPLAMNNKEEMYFEGEEEFRQWADKK
ncbi:uncharacterized protein VTP21DRAFT_3550 [Calcarisporiella thermophila]|uniref:uncharacterized protein n=1 Tax=Calcarisporiella thermophila TaxID=911321 RepID=UPI0037427144